MWVILFPYNFKGLWVFLDKDSPVYKYHSMSLLINKNVNIEYYQFIVPSEIMDIGDVSQKKKQPKHWTHITYPPKKYPY